MAYAAKRADFIVMADFHGYSIGIYHATQINCDFIPSIESDIEFQRIIR